MSDMNESISAEKELIPSFAWPFCMSIVEKNELVAHIKTQEGLSVLWRSLANSCVRGVWLLQS